MFLTFITFLPIIGAFFLAFFPKENEGAIKQTALAVAAADFLLSLFLWANFDNSTHKMQFELNISWIESWGINYHIGLDGISLLLYVMTTFLTLICIIASWDVKKHIREYMMAMLALSTGMLGVFISLDLFIFYVFWEFQLVPMYIIVGVWGGPRRIYAAVKFFIYTAVGSLLMLVAIIWIYFHVKETTGVATADILTDGRLILGVARGAFPWEMKRLGTPIEHSKEKFTESLEVLQKLLSEEEVSFSGKYYNFEALTIMPRPITQPIPIMIAAMDPKSIKNAALRGFHVQSTVLSGTRELLMERVNAFRDGCEELGEKGKLLKLSMQRMMFVAKDEKDAEIKNKLAYEYYKRFDNMFTGPGKVKNGNIIPLPRKQSFEEMKDNLLICPINELIDKLSIYAESGVDEFIISSSFGQEQNETIESMHKISEEIIPYFKNSKNQVA